VWVLYKVHKYTLVLNIKLVTIGGGGDKRKIRLNPELHQKILSKSNSKEKKGREKSFKQK